MWWYMLPLILRPPLIKLLNNTSVEKVNRGRFSIQCNIVEFSSLVWIIWTEIQGLVENGAEFTGNCKIPCNSIYFYLVKATLNEFVPKNTLLACQFSWHPIHNKPDKFVFRKTSFIGSLLSGWSSVPLCLSKCLEVTACLLKNKQVILTVT